MSVEELRTRALSDQVRHCKRLAQALKLTEQMLAHAEKDEWQRVTELEVERRDDLVACFSREIPPADTELVAQAMAALLHLNEELMSRLKLARSAAMAQGRELSNKRQAVNSYRAVEAASSR
ncbi:MAG: flagellar protein FliT [Halioglobus sp.]|nr:flagellar protein FliT [Halioglobus sp.]